MTNSKQAFRKNQTTNRQFEREQELGSKKYRLRQIEDQEQEDERMEWMRSPRQYEFDFE